MEGGSPGAQYARELLADVDSVRRRLVVELVRLMSTASPAEPAEAPKRVGAREYAVAHHVVATMREGALHKDADLMRQARQLWSAVTAWSRSNDALTAAGDLIAVRSSEAVPLSQVESEMPVWAIPGDALTERADAADSWVRPAAMAASDSGYRWLTDHALSIVVSLHPRRLDEATSSWTVSVLPCTIYTDYYPAPALMGKDLVHEAAHSWLNDCLTATRDRLEGEAEYWSPWKQRHRTPFGIVHSGFAFSCVVNFLTWLIGVATQEQVVGYCARRLPAERARLVEARTGIERALELVRDDRVRQMVRAELASATDGAPL